MISDRSEDGHRYRIAIVLPFAFFLTALISFSDSGARCQDKVVRSEQADLFDRGRWYWQQPSKIMDLLGVKAGMTIADVGAGYGYFTLGLAGLVGEKGRVYANDVCEDCLKVIEEDCRNKKIANVVTILGEPNDPKLPKGTVDLVLMVNVLMYLDDPQGFLKNLKPCLRTDGTLAVVEWVREKGYSQGKVRTSAEIRELLERSGFSIVSVEPFLPRQHVFVCRASPEERTETTR